MLYNSCAAGESFKGTLCLNNLPPMQACTEDLDQLRHEHSSEKAAHAALRQEAGQLRGRLAELGGVEEKLASLQQQHTAAEAKLEQLEQEKLVRGSASDAFAACRHVWVGYAYCLMHST